MDFIPDEQNILQRYGRVSLYYAACTTVYCAVYCKICTVVSTTLGTVLCFVLYCVPYCTFYCTSLCAVLHCVLYCVLYCTMYRTALRIVLHFVQYRTALHTVLCTVLHDVLCSVLQRVLYCACWDSTQTDGTKRADSARTGLPALHQVRAAHHEVCRRRPSPHPQRSRSRQGRSQSRDHHGELLPFPVHRQAATRGAAVMLLHSARGCTGRCDGAVQVGLTGLYR